MELLDVMKSVNKIDPDTQVFYEVTAVPMIKKFNLEKEHNINYFRLGLVAPDVMEKSFISPTLVMPNYPTVIDTAILIAVYMDMGFKEIYLLGCDCTGILSIAESKLHAAEKSAYGYQISENEKKRMERVSSERSMVNELKSYIDLIYTYARLQKYCERNGCKLYNATEGELLECLPRVNLDDVLKG